MSLLNLKIQIFNNQEYAKIRDACSKGENKTLWEDTSYEATYDGRSDWEWKRPGEIVSNPRFIKAGSKEEPTRFNLNNLNLGESKNKEVIKYNIAALSVLTLNSSTFRFVVPDDNVEFSQGNYAGLFHFRIWRYGKFFDIVVDDLLPTRGGQLVSFVKDGHPVEFWPLLLDKAYTKLCGLAESLSKTVAPELLVDLTGGISETYISHGHLKSKTAGLETVLHKASERGSLIVFGRHWQSDNQKMEMKNIYCITKAVYIDIGKSDSDKPDKPTDKPGAAISGSESDTDIYFSKSEQVLMFKVFMPFITESKGKEWTGPWSENSNEWKAIPESRKGGIGVVQRHEFLISFPELSKHDWEIHIVHLNPQYIKNWGGKLNESLAWFPTEAIGKWVRGVSSGGNRREYLDSSFYLNPQFSISLEMPETKYYSDCTLIISALQKTQRSNRASMNIYLFQLKQKAEERFDWDFFRHSNPMIDKLQQNESKELTMRFHVRSGEYLVVVATETPQQEGNFIFRVFADHTIAMKALNERVVHKDVDVRVGLAYNEPDYIIESDKNVWAYFDEVSGEKKVVGWKGLQKVLDYAMDNEKPRPNSNYTVRNSLLSYVFPSKSVFDTMEEKEFSKDLARSLLAMADFDHSGKLSLMEFQGLWAQIRQWIKIYEMNSDDNGFLPKESLREALDSAGFQLNSDILCSLATRYSNRDNVIPFDDFLICASKLRTVFDYYRFKDPEFTDQAVFTLEEWLQKSIYS